MLILEIVIIVLYAASLLLISFFSLGQLALLFAFFRKKKTGNRILSTQLPYITIQLPLFNEKYLVEQLLLAVGKLEYPPDRLEIQILDDSTDETSDIIRTVLNKYPIRFGVHYISRKTREGFKAGALQNGLRSAKGEFIAIFDADFLPESNFLLRMMPHFYNGSVGMVQARWGHLNPDESWLTRVQGIALNGHFLVDQQARSQNDYFINFNGTAGIWRKACISDAGGWQADTLTEDLDLSYRAQLKGWKFVYCKDIVAPAELPAMLSSFKTQQFRWVKGGVETSRKILPALWNSALPLSTKMYGSFHLLSSFTYIFILLSAILSVPALIIKNNSSRFDFFFDLSYFLAFIILINLAYFFVAIAEDAREKDLYKEFFVGFTFSMLLLLGLSIHHSKAVWQGFAGRKTTFKRTPKGSPKGMGNAHNRYISTAKLNRLLPELALSVYFSLAILTGISLHDYTFIGYHAMMLTGFATVISMTLKESKDPNVSPALC